MFTQEIIDYVWGKAIIVPNYDKNTIRKDACGAWILYSQYGNRESEYGWEIDHVFPIALGGDDNRDNLRAMQWENNLKKSDDYPSYTSAVLAVGTNNAHIEKQFTVNNTLQETLHNLYSI